MTVFNQHQIYPTSMLCSIVLETRQHFIAGCSVFKPDGDFLKQQIFNNF